MREKFIEEMVKEVYGPRKGVTEKIEGDPRKEYITGVIIPQACRETEPDPDSESPGALGEESLADDDETDEEIMVFTPSELDPKMKPKSFGISFVVKGGEPSFDICMTWGRYFWNEDDGVWQRKPFNVIKHISVENETEKISLHEGEDGKILLYLRKIPKGEDHHVIVVNVLNDLNINPKKCYGKNLTEASVFQPSIRINLDEGLELTPIYIDPSEEDRHLHFLYRDKPVLARGYMCSAIWQKIDYPERFKGKTFWADGHNFDECKNFMKPDVRSEFVPMHPDPSPIFRWDEERYEKSPELSTQKLSETWESDQIDRCLTPIIDGYEKWISENERHAKDMNESDGKISAELIEHQREALERLKRGIQILKDDKDARVSFCFANRTIWLQNSWKKNAEDFRWRPFQLAFILLNVESIYDSNSEYRDFTDLLWIPTGGGKTEAYLAIMAFTMALRRRRARRGMTRNKTGGGTAIITRYTLRLLTVQQFRRTLRMVTAAEYLRIMETERGNGWRPQKCDIDDELMYGSVRFSTGMWVGGAVSPNHLRKDGHAIDALNGHDSYGEPAQIITCPACDSWLSVPNSGLPEGRNTFYVVMRSSKIPEDITREILSHKNDLEHLEDFQTEKQDVPAGHFTAIMTLNSSRKIREKEIDSLMEKIKKIVPLEVVSFRASRPGYFGYGSEPGRIKDMPVDFEIFCPNPGCPLNGDISYKEGIPSIQREENEKLPDGLVPRHLGESLFSGSRMPIPACTVDEQVYHRCPTVVVSTADKIARLAFEPRAASILGNVDSYNSNYGYHRDGLFPDKVTERGKREHDCEVDPFDPPELIVQDELHLMEGPLGSVFGLYENIVEGLIKTVGGKPKYIASTATIKDADFQIKHLFAKDVFQFPPHGLNIDHSFFVKFPDWENSWEENRPGRVYMGIYSPGMGPLTPNVRIWSRLLKTGQDNLGTNHIRNFWTTVGYFNAIRELGGTVGLYREDIVERLKHISNGNQRELDQSRVVELSSRIDSTDIPHVLDELERGGKRDLDKNPDAIFTTSMFGTGVDIPHLSMMVVNGQPKTTSQYIQATGRVGRTHGGLIVTFLRAGRPRDLSHYEMFPAYHQRKYIEVEPPSVFPFAEGCLARASGPATVSFLRNMFSPSVDWYNDDGMVILDANAQDDIQRFKEIIFSRIERIIQQSDKMRAVREYFNSQIDAWVNTARRLHGNEELAFEEPASRYRRPEKNVVLGDPQHAKAGVRVVYKNAPQSLREIEETTGFGV